MTHPSGKRKLPHEEEEHENHERWLVSYADMVTLLMCLFIVLFAMSQVDQAKYAALASGLSQGFGAPMAILDQGAASTSEAMSPAPPNINQEISPDPGRPVTSEEVAQEQARQRQIRAAAEVELEKLKAIQKQVEEALAAAGLADRVNSRINERGLILGVVADDVFFDNASATIRPTGLRVLDVIAPTLVPQPNAVVVEGHANNLPLTNSIYPSNWELSGARSAAVARRLVDDGIVDTRLSATGYSSSRPLFPHDDPRAISGNRRVDLVVESTAPAASNALLPVLNQEK